MDWEPVRRLVAMQVELPTITRERFWLVGATDNSVTVEVSSGRRYSISRRNLERAIELLRRGETLAGPSDYRNKVADDRPAYAWAILRELGYVR